MRRALRTLTFLTAMLAAGALWAGAAAATPEQVLADQTDNGIVDGVYSADDLRAAIVLAKERAGAQSDAAISAVRDAQARTLFGADPDQGATVPGIDVPAAAPGPDAVARELARPDATPPVLRLPEAPVIAPGATVPLPFVILSGVAGLMLLGGIGASTFRRLSRTATRGPHGFR